MVLTIPRESVLEANMKAMIAFYNCELERFEASTGSTKQRDRVSTTYQTDPTQISWTWSIESRASRKRYAQILTQERLSRSLFIARSTKQWLYFDRHVQRDGYQMPSHLPDMRTSRTW